jgi:hypothetical protein
MFADHQSVRLSVTPFFHGMTGSRPQVNLPLIPGGNGP